MRALILLVALLAPSRVAHADPPLLFAMMGQSNMVGCFDGLPSPDACSSGQCPRLEVLGNDADSNGSVYWRTSPVEPLDCALTTCGLACNQGSTNCGDVISKDDGVQSGTCSAAYGPEQQFGVQFLTTNLTATVALIPCARGGAYMATGQIYPSWLPTANHDDRSTLYGSCHHRMTMAIPHGSLTGVVIFQGESDANTNATASVYATNFNTFLDGLFNDWGSGLKICFGQLSSNLTAFPFYRTVQDQQASIHRGGVRMYVTSNYGCTAVGQPNACCSGVGTGSCEIPVQPSGGHFTQAGYTTLGQRMAECMNALLPAPTPTNTPTPIPPTPTPCHTLVGFSCPGGPAGCP